MATKICRTCKETLDISAFAKKKRGQCDECQRTEDRARITPEARHRKSSPNELIICETCLITKQARAFPVIGMICKMCQKSEMAKYRYHPAREGRKTCRVCLETKDMEEFNFRESGIPRTECKECKKKYCAKRYAENPEPTKQAAARFRREHPEEFKAYQDERVKRNPQEGLIRRKKWALKNPEKHKLSAKVSVENRRSRLLGAGGSFTGEEWKDLCKRQNYRCLCCGKKEPLHADHVIPVAKGGTGDIGNLQGLCKSCNSKKHTKATDYRLSPHPDCQIDDRIFSPST